MPWPKNIAHLNITSWRGISFDAVHFYGKLHYGMGNYIEIKRKLTKEESDKLNHYDRMDGGVYFGYKEGDETNRFDKPQDVIDETLKILEKEYPQVDLLFEGTGASVSCNKALWGKDQKLVNRINELYKEADRLNFYSGIDDDRVEELDDEFENLIGLELLK